MKRCRCAQDTLKSLPGHTQVRQCKIRTAADADHCHVPNTRSTKLTAEKRQTWCVRFCAGAASRATRPALLGDDARAAVHSWECSSGDGTLANERAESPGACAVSPFLPPDHRTLVVPADPYMRMNGATQKCGRNGHPAWPTRAAGGIRTHDILITSSRRTVPQCPAVSTSLWNRA